MKVRTDRIKEMAAAAAADQGLHQTPLAAAGRFRELRQGRVASFDDLEKARDQGRRVKERCLAELDRLLPRLEKRVRAAGGGCTGPVTRRRPAPSSWAWPGPAG